MKKLKKISLITSLLAGFVFATTENIRADDTPNDNESEIINKSLKTNNQKQDTLESQTDSNLKSPKSKDGDLKQRPILSKKETEVLTEYAKLNQEYYEAKQTTKNQGDNNYITISDTENYKKYFDKYLKAPSEEGKEYKSNALSKDQWSKLASDSLKNNYQEIKIDKQEKIDPYHLTNDQEKSISLFGARILNDVRSQLGLSSLSVNQGIIDFAHEIAVTSQKKGFNKFEHDVDTINSLSEVYGLARAPDSTKQRYEQAAYQVSPNLINLNTMDDLKRLVYEMIRIMLFGSSTQNEFDHTRGLLGVNGLTFEQIENPENETKLPQYNLSKGEQLFAISLSIEPNSISPNFKTRSPVEYVHMLIVPTYHSKTNPGYIINEERFKQKLGQEKIIIPTIEYDRNLDKKHRALTLLQNKTYQLSSAFSAEYRLAGESDVSYTLKRNQAYEIADILKKYKVKDVFELIPKLNNTPKKIQNQQKERSNVNNLNTKTVAILKNKSLKQFDSLNSKVSNHIVSKNKSLKKFKSHNKVKSNLALPQTDRNKDLWLEMLGMILCFVVVCLKNKNKI